MWLYSLAAVSLSKTQVQPQCAWNASENCTASGYAVMLAANKADLIPNNNNNNTDITDDVKYKKNNRVCSPPKKGMVQARKPVKQTYKLLYTRRVGRPLGMRCFTMEHSIISSTGIVYTCSRSQQHVCALHSLPFESTVMLHVVCLTHTWHVC